MYILDSPQSTGSKEHAKEHNSILALITTLTVGFIISYVFNDKQYLQQTSSLIQINTLGSPNISEWELLCVSTDENTESRKDAKT